MRGCKVIAVPWTTMRENQLNLAGIVYNESNSSYYPEVYAGEGKVRERLAKRVSHAQSTSNSILVLSVAPYWLSRLSP